PTLGIILCKSKSKMTVEYALQGNIQPSGVSTYKLRDSLPPDLQQKLPSPEQLEMELDSAIRQLEADADTTPDAEES
ncbi:MAG: PDDEXK nuclease domain-containing protein, partial [Bacteroidota bacterium]